MRLWRGADAKMVLYLVGACALQWHVLSFCALAARGTASGDVPAAAATYGALMSWFLLEYMVGEVVHLVGSGHNASVSGTRDTEWTSEVSQCDV